MGEQGEDAEGDRDGEQVEADGDRRQRDRPQDHDQDQEGDEGDRGDHERHPVAGDVAVVVELGGAAGDPGFEAGLFAQRRGGAVEALVERLRAVRVEGELGDHQDRGGLAAVGQVDRAGRRFARRRRRPVDRREHEVAGVEQARRGFGDAARLLVDPRLAFQHLHARSAAGAPSCGRDFFGPFGKPACSASAPPPSWSMPPTRAAVAALRRPMPWPRLLAAAESRAAPSASCVRAGVDSAPGPSASWRAPSVTFLPLVIADLMLSATLSASFASSSKRACSGFEFDRQPRVSRCVGRAADRVGAADRRGGAAHRFQRRRVVGVGLADRHPLQLRPAPSSAALRRPWRGRAASAPSRSLRLRFRAEACGLASAR